MSSDRAAQTLGAALAALWLVVVTVADMALPGDVVLVVLLGLAPLIACAVLPAAATAAYAGAAVALTLASASWNGNWGSVQQSIRVVDVALIGAAAVVIAVVRVRREGSYARMAVIAEVAQRAVLPILPSRVGTVAASARYLSAVQDAMVGGDLYDCYHDDGSVRFLVGDVRGKGIGAVEQAARVIRAFRQAAATQATLPAVAEHMSAYLAPFFDDEEFVTALLADATAPDRLTLVSSGHPPPLHVRPDGSASLPEAPAGLPLGLGMSYQDMVVPWGPGDRLLMYTDGLSEARDGRGQFLPLLPLAQLVATGSVDDALDELLDRVREHVPGAELSDDLAVVLLENLAVGPFSASGVEHARRDEARAVVGAPLDDQRRGVVAEPLGGGADVPTKPPQGLGGR